MKRTVFFISAVITLAGCSGTAPAVKEYTILPSKSVQSLSAPLASGSLRIAAAKTIPSLASKNIYYLREGGEAGKYLYSRWSDTPASLIERSLTSSLQERGVFGVLLSSTSTARPSYLLESDLNAFYHRFPIAGASEGYIDATYRLIDPTTNKTLGSKRFQLTVKASSDDAKGGVEALSKATEELSLQCTLWLSRQIQENQ